MNYSKEELDLLLKIVHSQYTKNYTSKKEKIILKKLIKKYLLEKINLLTGELKNGFI